MNKQKFVEYLRSPESLSESQFQELEQLLVDYPYFSIAKSVAARASRNLNSANKRDLIASAAIYATDRRHLKRYVNGEVIFLADAPKIKTDIPKDKSEKSQVPVKEDAVSKESPTIESDIAVPTKMEKVHSDVDQILDELQRDMEELKKSRLHFVEIQNQLDDDIPHRPFAKEETKNENLEAAPELEETKEEKESKNPKTKDSDSNISNLIDSFKKKFAEEEGDKKTETHIEKPKSSVAKPEDEKEPRESLKDKAKTDSKEISKPEPSKSTKPSIVTNMDKGDEDQESKPLDPKDKLEPVEKKQKVPARANRGSRQKIKREDLEKLMGIPSKAVVPEESKSDSKESKVEKKAKKPVTKKTTTSAKTKKTKPKKEIAKKAKGEKATTDKKSATEKSVEKKTESIKAETPSNKEDEPSNRSSARSFLDFGGTGDMSSSVSRASSSRRKRSTRSSKSKSDSGEKKGGDDDDSSGPNDLIEKFITQNPSIQRRALKENKTDLSEKSTEWQPDLASEYLAEIYLTQGNKQRAIQIYEALILKFPEKKSYFAALIEKIQG